MTTTLPTIPLLAGLVDFLATRQAPEGLFTPDVVMDMNVPAWRFQVRGPAGLAALRRQAGGVWRVSVGRAVPTVDGFVAETSYEEEHDGETIYTRSINLVRVREGRIAEVIHYCTGPWDEQTRRRQAEQAPMVRS